MRDLKRGAAAWDNAKEEAHELSSLGEKLLVHAVSDRTALQSYFPAIRRWLDFTELRQLRC